MSEQDPPQRSGDVPGPGSADQPSEEQIRQQLEQEIRKVKVADVVLQSLVSILNLSARRIAKDDERDLEQGKLGIDASLALVELVPQEAQTEIRRAISELQMLYAQHAGGGGPEDGGSEGANGGDPPERQNPPPEPPPKGKGDSGLWTP